MEWFLARLEVYGGDIERWPAEERAAARACLRDAPAHVQTVLAEARALDETLARAPGQEVSAALLGRVVQSASQAQRGGALDFLRAAFAGGARTRASVATACALVITAGAVAGWTTSSIAAETVTERALIAALSVDTYDDLFTAAELDG